jgi:hypothetical protein
LRELPTSLREDFRNFLYVTWKFLGLPDPTDAQYEIAYFMQHGYPETYVPVRGRSDMVRAFRGVGKSWIAGAFVDWRLARDPENEKILVASKSGTKAGEFVDFTKKLIMSMPELAFLRPGEGQRDKAAAFDVRGASIAQQPSMKALGITGQLPGNRATLIVGDDVETTENAKTEAARENLIRQVNEFDAIKVPALLGPNGEVLRPAADTILLGTPQTEESVYNRLCREQGYNVFTVPARFPTEEKRKNYLIKTDHGHTVDILAPFVREKLEVEPAMAGKPVDPRRFSEDDLIGREAKGRSFFALQYQLDTSLSDQERYPLKQSDLVVMSIPSTRAPLVLQWGRDSQGRNVLNDIPNVGFTGDYFMGPLFQDNEFRDFEGSVLFVDPAGRGKDETAWAIVKALNGQLFVPAVGGFNGDMGEGMTRVARAARDHRVNKILVEPNFAGSIWIAAFQPILASIWPGTKGEPGGCTVEEAEWSKGQKEMRIIDTLEPVMNQHRLIIDESVARDDILMYQLTHITRDRGALSHDDRIDALAGAVASFEAVLRSRAEDDRQSYLDQEKQRMVDEFEEMFQDSAMGFRRRVSRRGRENIIWANGW